MMPLSERRDELDAIPDAPLLRLLLSKNPFGGYSIYDKQTREEVIETILRFEGYKQNEIEKSRHV